MVDARREKRHDRILARITNRKGFPRTRDRADGDPVPYRKIENWREFMEAMGFDPKTPEPK